MPTALAARDRPAGASVLPTVCDVQSPSGLAADVDVERPHSGRHVQCAVVLRASLEASASMKKPITADAPRLPKSRFNIALFALLAAGPQLWRCDALLASRCGEVPSVLPGARRLEAPLAHSLLIR